MVADGAAGGRPVLIALSVRRFRCPEPSCPKATFAEQAEGVSQRYRRRSVPLLGMLAGFGLELAGRAAARLAGTLGVPVHSATVLRLVMALPDPPVTAAPEVTGVDDFALRKGRVYGTVIADAESGQVVDLLPDREAGTLQAWLEAHGGAEVICRDRAGAYADGAAAGAPGAIQVADRWHLWHNLGEYVEKAVVAHRGCLTAAPGEPAAEGEDAPPGQLPDAGPDEAPAPVPDGLRDVHGRERALVSRTLDRHAAVHELLRAGRSQREAAEILGLSRNTVNRFARQAGPAALLVKATGRDSRLDPFKPWINRRWNEGLTSAAALHAEMAATQGWAGSVQAVERYVRQFRTADGRTRKGKAPRPAPAAPPVPKTRQITRWLLTRPARLATGDQARLAEIKASCPRPRTAARCRHTPPRRDPARKKGRRRRPALCDRQDRLGAPGQQRPVLARGSDPCRRPHAAGRCHRGGQGGQGKRQAARWPANGHIGRPVSVRPRRLGPMERAGTVIGGQSRGQAPGRGRDPRRRTSRTSRPPACPGRTPPRAVRPAPRPC